MIELGAEILAEKEEKEKCYFNGKIIRLSYILQLSLFFLRSKKKKTKIYKLAIFIMFNMRSKRVLAILFYVIVPYLLIAGLAVIVGNMVITGMATNWQCNVVNCTEWMTPQEWTAQNCFLGANGTMCNVDYQGQKLTVPLDQLNLQNLKQCKKYDCIQEVQVRSVDYDIEIPQQQVQTA